jgi:hypothetical protein
MTSHKINKIKIGGQTKHLEIGNRTWGKGKGVWGEGK